MPQNPRQLAFLALRAIQRGAFADVALDRLLCQANLSTVDRGLATELVYGCTRRQRTLDAWIDHLARKKANQQPPDLRLILHLGLYQLMYLDHVPPSAAVNTSVDLAKQNGLTGLAGFVNGLLRQYLRGVKTNSVKTNSVKTNGKDAGENATTDHGSASPSPLFPLPPLASPASRLGMVHSYPDWIVQVWLDQLGLEATERLCEWMNQPPHIDLRINPLRATIATVEQAMHQAGVSVGRVSHLPQALRLLEPSGSVQRLPGFEQGWWTVQDSSAQLVAYLVDPQPGEIVIDACAAPGGKTTHLAELMHDQGTVWACDRTPTRLKKLQQNAERLGLHTIKICVGDSRNQPQFIHQADRVLVDAPCSGLGTLNRHADARWRQTPASVKELAVLQLAILEQAATWVKPDGTLVYATCTLHPAENEEVIQAFLTRHPSWVIDPPASSSLLNHFTTPDGWVKLWSHQHQMDGFFMVRLRKS